MKHIAAIIQHAVPGYAPSERRERRQLPDPSALAPDDATALGSQLLAGGANDLAFPYLVRGLQARPSAFGWCRLGKLCREAGHLHDAVRCYDEALLLAPRDRYAIVGRAGALAESDDASLDQLVGALEHLAELLRDGGERTPVAWTAYGIMRAISRRWSHPLIAKHAEALKSIAYALDRRSGHGRQRELERQLDATLRVRELLGEPFSGSHPAAPEGPRAFGAESSVTPRLLPAGGNDTDT